MKEPHLNTFTINQINKNFDFLGFSLHLVIRSLRCDLFLWVPQTDKELALDQYLNYKILQKLFI